MQNQKYVQRGNELGHVHLSVAIEISIHLLAVYRFYENKKLDKEKNEIGEVNLSALSKEYIEKIQSPQKPRLMKDQ
jgi:hypothetical protein